MSYGYTPRITFNFNDSIKTPYLKYGANAIQVWFGDRRKLTISDIDEHTFYKTSQFVTNNDIFLISHSPYVINFAKPLQNSTNGKRALKRYLKDLEYIDKMGGVGSILHMPLIPEGQSKEESYKNLVENLEWIIKRKPKETKILLESMTANNRLGIHIVEFSNFWGKNLSLFRDEIKICIDTAHLYAVGEYDISEPEEIEEFFSDFDELIGINNIACIHFNSSRTKLGSHSDKHANISEGYISYKGMREIATRASEYDIPLIMETFEPIKEQMDLLGKWIRE